jgi:CRISPR-associated protein Cas2
MSRSFVIGYDVRHPRRLLRVHRAMCKHAVPIEYSVFVLEGSEQAAARCMAEVTKLIDPTEDDLRCYPLPSRGIRFRLGKPALPEGIVWTGLPAGSGLIG